MQKSSGCSDGSAGCTIVGGGTTFRLRPAIKKDDSNEDLGTP